MIAQITAIVLGTLVVTSEYGTGMIRATLAATPRRGAVLAAKALVVSCDAVRRRHRHRLRRVLRAATGSSTGEGVGLALSDDGVLRALFGSGLYLAGLGLFAAALGLLVRHTAAVLSTVLGLVFVVGQMAWLLPGTWGEWIAKLMPGNAGVGGGHAGLVQPGPARARGPGSRCSPARSPSCCWWRSWCSGAGTPEPAPPLCPGPVRPGHSGAVTSPDPAAEGRRRADEFLTLLATDDDAGATACSPA